MSWLGDDVAREKDANHGDKFIFCHSNSLVQMTNWKSEKKLIIWTGRKMKAFFLLLDYS